MHVESSEISSPVRIKRVYLVKWRFVFSDRKIGDPVKRRALYRYYLPKWSLFFNEIIHSYKISRDQLRELPFLRDVVPANISLVDIVDLLTEKNESLARLLIDAAPIFDISPHDLKIHIIASFKVSSTDYVKFEDAQRIADAKSH